MLIQNEIENEFLDLNKCLLSNLNLIAFKSENW